MPGANAGEFPEMAGLRSVADLAASDGVRECLKWLSGRKRWIDQKHLELCRIPAPTFREQERAEWMMAELKTLGCAAEIDRAGNVVAGSHREGDQPCVALTAHLDTVLAPLRPEDIAVGADGRLLGPGVSDNGAGLAALLAIAGSLQDSPLLDEWPNPLLFIANVGEEGEGNLSGMRFLCSQSSLAGRIRTFIVLDGPATDHITCRAVPSRRFEVLMSGPGGHSWNDCGTPNPVHALSRAITLFSEERVNGSGARGTDAGGAPAAPRCSFNFGIIEGGTSVNAIPATASAKVDLRSEAPPQIDEMASLLTTVVERALETENGRNTGTRLTAKIREIGSRPGGRLAEDSPLLKCLRAVDAHLGIRSQPECASTDANIPLSLGLEALSIGGGGRGGGVHTPSEWYDPGGREIGLKRIVLALCLLMRSLRGAGPVTGN